MPKSGVSMRGIFTEEFAMSRILLAGLLLSLSHMAGALTFMSINTEWFWDELEPHEGTIAVGPVGHGAHAKEVELEAFAIATLIQIHQADVVGLVEVEGDGRSRARPV